MREMKDSGIEWIGDIPLEWYTVPFRAYVNERVERNKGNKTDELLALSFALGVTLYKDKIYNKDRVKEDFEDYKIVHKNDLVLSPNDIIKGSIYVSPYYGCISPMYYIFEPRYIKTHSLYYLSYLLRTKEAGLRFFYIARGLIGSILDNGKYVTRRMTVSRQDLLTFKVLLPPIKEQLKIVAFLDTKCAEIDSLSADIQCEIETLEAYKRSVITEAVTKGLNPDVETKKSEIFYMAPYNKKWRLSKIGYECFKLQRTFLPEDNPLICTNKGKVIIRPEDITGKMVSEDNAMQGIHKGDIAIHGMDTWHGAIALSEHSGKITRVVHVCDSKQDKRFIVYYLQQLAFNGVYKLISNGVRGNTSDFRSWEKVKDIYIALPSIEEQIEISNFLDRICSEIDSIISQKKEQINVLADYKKSLIYEYVTGKKEVPIE